MATPVRNDSDEPKSRLGHAAVEHNGKVYMWGGWDAPDHPISASEIEVLDTTTGKWTKLPTKGTPPTGVHGGAYVAVGDKIYTYGGWISADDCSGDLHELNLTTMSWRQLKPKNPSEGPRKKYGCGILFYNDMLVVFAGGQHHSSTNVDELHVYDLKENTWSSPHVTGTPPEARAFFSFAMIDDHKAFLFGGNLKNRDRANGTYILDLQLWHWNKVPPSGPSPVGRTRHTTCCLSGSITGTHTSLVLVMGGLDQRDEVLGDAWIYQVDSGTWTEVNLCGQVHLTTKVTHERLSVTVIAYGPNSMHLLLFGGWRIVGSTTMLTVVLHMKYLPYSGWVVAGVIPTSQLEQSEETATQTVTQDTVSSPQAKIEELSQTLAEKDRKVKEYRDALTRSQQMLEEREQKYAQSLAEKELQISSYHLNEREIQAAMEQRDAQLRLERKQREEAEHQFKTSQSKVDEMQLKMNELWKENEKLQEEKEKLQGQLQDAQATLTSEEKQQQLTPSEKSDQAIQTHGEPSYLQILAQTAQEFQATLDQRESQLDWERRRREEVEQQHKREVDEMQLQIDELQERVKLAGHQLQSSQSTGEAALTTKETQEQLSQPEKMDHKGPLPATQATGEATTTTKEIQEQLTLPKKRDQSVQTYAEPPFLQTSEVGGKLVLAAMDWRIGLGAAAIIVVVAGVAVMLGLTGTTTTIHGNRSERRESGYLQGVDVVNQTSLTYSGKAYSFHWEKHGFKIHFPDNALPPGTSECHVTITASISGQYQFPKDSELVSGIYWIACPVRFTRPVTLEVQHCSSQTEADEDQPSFVIAKYSQENLPYTFRVLEGGIFPPTTSYGSIQLTGFSGVTIISPVRTVEPAVEPEITEPEKRRYCGQLYYGPQYSTIPSVKRWKVYFVISLDLDIHVTAIDMQFSGYARRTSLGLEVQFGDSEKKITLNLHAERVEVREWTVTPAIFPPMITKDQVNNYKPGTTAQPASCQIIMDWKGREEPISILHKVDLEGTRHHNAFILELPPPPLPPGPDIQQPPLDSPQAATDCHEIETKADRESLEQELAEIGNWESLCNNLGVHTSALVQLRVNAMPVENKKMACLATFVNGEQPCWEKVVQVVAAYPFHNKRLAKTIANKHHVDYNKVVPKD